VSFDAITHCVAYQRVFVVVYFVFDSVRKILNTPSYYNKIPVGVIYPFTYPIRDTCSANRNHINFNTVEQLYKSRSLLSYENIHFLIN
jgi:hypothetical protein